MVLCSAQLAVERDSAYSTTLAVARGKPLAGLREVTKLRDGSGQRMSNRCLTGVRGGTRRGVSLGPAHRPAGPARVPQSRYNEFVDGLACIGSWQLEAARFPLPDAVHMTIRVNE